MERPAPALPAAWPYVPRSLPDVVRLEAVEFPGLGKGWRWEGLETGLGDGASGPLRGAFGRGGIQVVGDRVVRPYRRGGLLRHVIRRTYVDPGRFRNEFHVHRALWGAGFPTVEPLGFAWRRRGLGVEGLFVTRYVEACPWPRCWDAPGVVEGLETAVRALVDWGLWAPDLNATNVLVGSEGGVQLLDWDRARWVEASDLLGRYQARLLRSLQKLKAPQDVLEPVRSWR